VGVGEAAIHACEGMQTIDTRAAERRFPQLLRQGRLADERHPPVQVIDRAHVRIERRHVAAEPTGDPRQCHRGYARFVRDLEGRGYYRIRAEGAGFCARRGVGFHEGDRSAKSYELGKARLSIVKIPVVIVATIVSHGASLRGRYGP
jgi:hypothetical protein